MLWLISASPALAASRLVFQAIDRLPGTDDCSMPAISSDGSVVVAACADTSFSKAQFLRWDAVHGQQPIDLPQDAVYCFGGLGVSGDGTTVAGTCPMLTGGAERWDAALQGQSLGTLSGKPNCESLGSLSSDGSVVVGDCDNFDSLNEAFRWDTVNGIRGLGVLLDTAVSFPNAVSSDGTVIVGVSLSADSSIQKAFRWDAVNGMQDLGSLPLLPKCESQSVSSDGSVVAGDCSSGSGSEVFRWDATNGMQGLGFPQGRTRSGAPMYLSADGSVVVGTAFGGSSFEALRWDFPKGIAGLGNLPGLDRCQPSASASDGSLVTGRCSDSQGVQTGEGFVWDAQHGIRDVQAVLAADGNDLTGWQLPDAQVSADGRTLFGSGNHMGHYEIWIAPEPSAFSHSVAALASLALLARRMSGRAPAGGSA